MRIKKYNPQFLTDEELIQSFVVRQQELSRILRVIRENDGPNNQHILLIAPRGFGKSTLVRRAAAEVRRDAQLSARWYPVVFPEESYEVSTAGEFWLMALERLARSTGDPRWSQAYESLRKEPDERRVHLSALGALRDFADERKVRLLLVVENLDQLLDEGQLSKDHAWTLRHTLLNDPRIMLLGTAVHRFEGVTQPDQPMFELFHHMDDIPPLDHRACDRVWGMVTGTRLGLRRAKAVRILSGGNPRLLVILAEFSSGSNLNGLLGDLESLIDDHTDYFRQNIEAVRGIGRRVFLALAELWTPAPARLVAETARLQVNETSMALGRLVKDGRVMVTRTQGKNHYYQVSERLYNIYYLMRRSEGPETRVRVLVDFLRYVYGAEEQPSLLGSLAVEACGRREGARGEHMVVIDSLLRQNTHMPDRLQEMVQRLPAELLRAKDLPETTKRVLKKPAALVALLGREDGERYLDDARTALAVVWRRGDDQPVKPDVEELARKVAQHPAADAEQLEAAALILLRTDEWRSSIAVFERALCSNPDLIYARSFLAKVLRQDGRAAAAVRVLEEGVGLHPLFQEPLGITLVNTGIDVVRGVTLLEGVTNWRSVNGWALDSLCEGYLALGRHAEALGLVQRLLASRSLNRLFREDEPMLSHLFWRVISAHPDSKAALELALALTRALPQMEHGWLLVIGLRVLQGEFAAALAITEGAPMPGPDSHLVRLRGLLYLSLGRIAEAEACARRHISAHPTGLAGWVTLTEVQAQTSPAQLNQTLASALTAMQSRPDAQHQFGEWLLMSHAPKLAAEALKFLQHPPNEPLPWESYARTVGLVKGPEAALGALRARLNSSGTAFDHNTELYLRALSLRLAAANLPRETAEVLASSPLAARLEPLIVALRLKAGEAVDAPIELLELSKDLHRRIDLLRDTGDLWRQDPMTLLLPDEIEESEAEQEDSAGPTQAGPEA